MGCWLRYPSTAPRVGSQVTAAARALALRCPRTAVASIVLGGARIRDSDDASVRIVQDVLTLCNFENARYDALTHGESASFEGA